MQQDKPAAALVPLKLQGLGTGITRSVESRQGLVVSEVNSIRPIHGTKIEVWEKVRLREKEVIAVIDESLSVVDVREGLRMGEASIMFECPIPNVGGTILRDCFPDIVEPRMARALKTAGDDNVYFRLHKVAAWRRRLTFF
jgi:hypothetical protein